MSLDSVQLNSKRLGLGSGSFGSRSMGVNTKTTGVSSQAAKNLQNSTSASSKNSVFNGMFAANRGAYNRVAGQNTLKGHNQVNLDRRRASLGNNGVSRSIDRGGPQYVATGKTQSSNGMNGLTKALMYTQLGMQAFQMGAQIFGGGRTNGQMLDAATAGMGAAPATTLASSAGQSAVAGMQNAQTSGELTAAIGNAENQLSTMKQTASSCNFAEKAQTANQKMSDYKTAVGEKKDGVKDAQQKVKTADGSVNAATNLRDSRLLALKNADAAYGAAVEAKIQAKDADNQAAQNLSNAQSTLANTPETITDANGNQVHNPQYDAAKKQVEIAQNAKTEAEKHLEQAQTKEAEAAKSVDATKTEVTSAKESLDKAQSTLDTAKKQQTEVQNSLITAQSEYQKAQETYQQAQEDVQKFQEYQHDTKELEAQIAKQKERLEKMKNKEDKKIDKLSAKIDKAVAKNESVKIDASDGMNLKERYLSGRMKSRNNKNAARLAEKEALIAGQRVPGQDA